MSPLVFIAYQATVGARNGASDSSNPTALTHLSHRLDSAAKAPEAVVATSHDPGLTACGWESRRTLEHDVMVVHSCHNFSAVTPCAVRSRQRLVAATSSHASVHGRQTARPTRRSRTVCFHSIEEAASPSENGEAASPTENGEEPTQHTQPIKNEDAAFGPRVRLSSSVACLL